MSRKSKRSEHAGATQDDRETAAVQALGWLEAEGDVVPAIRPATTFQRRDYSGGRTYGRVDSPATEQAEAILCALEGGTAARVFASGMGAASAVFQGLPPGAHVIAPRSMYFEMRKWLETSVAEQRLSVDFLEELTPGSVQAVIQPGRTRLVWIETPSNPFWHVTDIAAVAAVARAAGARTAVDSTTASPVLTRPLELGADLVMHSLSKYLNGHSDVLGGAVICACDDDYWQKIIALRQANGALLGPFESWLLVRGMRTLFLRVERACNSALQIARFLAQHPGVSEVLYPGLPSHPGHEIASRQMQGGFGGMLSFRVAAGNQAALKISASTRLFVRATSLGGVESLIEHRASVEDAGSRVPGDLLRLSVGIEPAGALIADLEAALAAAASV